MKCADYAKLRYSWQYRYTPKRTAPKNVIALDTETFTGKCFLLADSNSRYIWSSDTKELLAFMHAKQYRSTLNVFFNIDYDVTAILKGLSREHLRELYTLGTTEIYGYTLRYIPKKRFSISKAKNVTTFYDIAQFFMSSLNNAAKKYLGKEKHEIDIEKFKKWSWIMANKDKIIKYCIQDCVLTADLMRYFQNLCIQLDVDCNKPVSCASLSAKYFMQHCDIPILNHKKVREYAFKSYSGGRFETFQRGYFDKLYGYDIKSAYPAVMSKLVDINKGYWRYSKQLEEKATYGFLLVEVTCENSPIEVLSYRRKGALLFPHLDKQQRYITLDEYRYITKHYDTEITIINGYYFFAQEEVYPFKILQTLYDQRNDLKEQGNDLQLVIKIIMNSIYGKMMEQITTYTTPKDLFTTTDTVDFVRDGKIITKQRVYKTGNLFNPVYGSLITSRVRLQLLNEMRKHPRDIVACYTDSIYTTRPFIETGTKLGDWSYEGCYNGLVLGNGVYTLQQGEKVKTGFRGFVATKGFSLIDELRKHPQQQKINISRKKVIRLGQWLLHNKMYKESDLNKFIMYDKTLRLNFDTKRVWERDFVNAKDALNNVIQSQPLRI